VNAPEVKKKFQTARIVFADETDGKSVSGKIFSGTTGHANEHDSNRSQPCVF
jgi:hypothetical protein